MAIIDPIDQLRLDLVEASADLRAVRQDLARMRRRVARDALLHGKTAKDREFERDLIVSDDPRVVMLENEVLKKQREQELAEARLESALRPVQEFQWLVRQRQADAMAEMAIAFSTNPAAGIALALAGATGERGTYQGESDYLAERALDY